MNTKVNIDKLIKTAITNNDYDLFGRTFKSIYKHVNEPINSDSIISRTIDIILLFKQKKYEDVVKYTDLYIKDFLLGYVRVYDTCISKIIRMYYLSRKYTGMSNDILFSILIPNKEMGNEECVSVLTNCILDYFISNNIYRRLNNTISQSELQRYNFYNGIIDLVEGNYKKALALFSGNSDVYKGSTTVKKYFIVTKLLLSDFEINLDYDKKLKKFFELIKIVKRADISKFLIFVQTYKSELVNDKLYFIVLRLSQNITQEKIRRMGMVYFQISYQNLCKNLNMEVEDLDYILKKSINTGIISGTISDNVYYSSGYKKKEKLQFNFEKVFQTYELLKSKMKYPEIELLCYEKATK